MHASRKSRLVVSLATLALLAASTSAARADEFSSDAANPEVIAGASTTVEVMVVEVADESPSDPGCNLRDPNANNNNPHHVDASVSSSDTTVVTASPTSLTFEDCGVAQTITLTVVGCSADPRAATVTVAETGRGPGQSVKGTFSTETINVSVPGNPNCVVDPGPGTFCSEPAAPAWAAAILKANNVKAKQASNLISMVAHRMDRGATFDGISKADQDDYSAAVHAYLQTLQSGLTIGPAGAARPGWLCVTV